MKNIRGNVNMIKCEVNKGNVKMQMEGNTIDCCTEVSFLMANLYVGLMKTSGFSMDSLDKFMDTLKYQMKIIVPDVLENADSTMMKGI